MKVTYTGQEDFTAKQREKLDAKLAKIAKLLDRKGEREAHVIRSKERFLHKVEITVNAHDHSMVGAASNADLYTASCEALEKLEKQVLKMRTKWRDTHRHDSLRETPIDLPVQKSATPDRSKTAKTAGKKAVAVTKKAARVFRVNHQDGRKPMTLEEATLEMGSAQDYLVYHDAKTNRVSVLMRRGDGHLDLIES